MKKHLSIGLAVIMMIHVILLCPLCVSAVGDEQGIIETGTCGSELTWTLLNDYSLIISGSGSMYDYLDDSRRFNHCPWYSYLKQINAITIEEGVTSIGNAAFFGSSISDITIPDSVLSIGDYAFKFCKSLKNINFGGGLKTIGNDAFYECENLTNVALPDSLKRIGSSFNYCENLKSVSLGSCLESIAGLAFQHCESLERLFIPASVTSIDNNAFIYCYGLTSVIVDGNNKNYSSDEYGVLFNKNKTVLIQYPISNKREKYVIPEGVTSIADYAFKGEGGISNMTFYGDGTVTYEEFENNSLLKEIVLPSSLTTIGKYSFEYCCLLTHISIPNSVTNIGYEAFGNCRCLTTVTLGDSISSISDYAFYGCNSLSSVIIPNSVKRVGNHAFRGCSNLSSVSIGDSVTSIGDYAFYGNSSLNSAIIGDSVISIGASAFYGSKNLSSINIGNSVTNIGPSSFSDCNNLSSVYIPDLVKSIGNCAFEGCSKLTDVYYSGSEDDWKTIAIGYNNNYLTNATIHYNSYGPNKFCKLNFFNGPTITGTIGDTIGTLIVLNSALYDITEIEYESSNTDIVDVDVISLGEGNYITQGNEQIATIYLNCKKEGTATITATAPDGSTATLIVTVETKPAVQKSIAVFTTEKSLCVKTGDKMWLAFGLLDDTTQELDGQWRKMAITNSDPTIVSLSDYSETEYGYSLELTGLKQGASHLTITDTETGINTIITVSVYDQYAKSYSYAIDNVSSFYPSNFFERKIATNIYNLNGLYVNNYSCKKVNGGYKVCFDVYNSKYYSGAVDVYNAFGKLINYEEIVKYSDITSLWDTGERLFTMYNALTYKDTAFSKKTSISIDVPEGGYFTISNNVSESPTVALLNSLEILFDTTCDFFDLAISGADKTTAFDGFKSSIKELTLKEIREKNMEIALSSLKKETKDIMKKLINTDFKNRIFMSNEVYSDMSTLSESILSSFNINWKHLFKSATGIGESYFTKFAGPAGVALKGCFAITKGSNKLLRATQMSASCDNTYATFYSNKSDCNINQHGVVVNTQGNVDAEAVLQVFKVSNDDTVVSAIDSSFDKYELYNISFVKNDQLVQPSGKVTVRIPIPQGMKGNTCKVYRKENNNEWTILDAHIEGNYLVFETNHFSLYTIIGDSESISIASLPTKLEYTSGQALNTDGLVLSINGEEVTEGYVCNPSVVSGTGTQTITVMYGNLVTEFEVNVNAPLLGDVDGDETVTILDATFIQRHLASIPIPFKFNEKISDSDEDGIISIMDATFIQRWLANLKANDNIGKPISK